MAKQKKKRNKKYTGASAKLDQPNVVRVKAVKRSKTGQWYHERKRGLKIIFWVVVVILVIIWSISSLFKI